MVSLLPKGRRPVLELVRFCRHALPVLRSRANCVGGCAMRQQGVNHASNWFFGNSSLLAPNALRYFKRLPRKNCYSVLRPRYSLLEGNGDE
jgi:hypothetical protein